MRNILQISVQRVHIRYEDTVSCTDHATACGIMLQEASVETTDEQWQPEWVGGVVPVVHKVQFVEFVLVRVV
jgi:vacuolar protein sorting-associated protein 13A/C